MTSMHSASKMHFWRGAISYLGFQADIFQHRWQQSHPRALEWLKDHRTSGFIKQSWLLKKS